MKNANMHNVFADAKTRDFLAKAMQTGLTKSLWEGSALIEQRIAELQEMLPFARQWEAALALIRSQGWEDWDVRNEIVDFGDDYFPFIGTAGEVMAVFEGYTID